MRTLPSGLSTEIGSTLTNGRPHLLDGWSSELTYIVGDSEAVLTVDVCLFGSTSDETCVTGFVFVLLLLVLTHLPQFYRK